LTSTRHHWRRAAYVLVALGWGGLAHPTAGAAQSMQGCDALVRAQSLLDQQAYRAAVTSANPGDEQSATTIIEAVGTERARVYSRGIEMVLVGPMSYARQGGEWQQVPIDMRNLAEQAKVAFDQGTCEASGPTVQEVEGARYDVYEFTLQAPGQEATTHGRMWVGSDGLPRRLEVESDVDTLAFGRAVMYDYDPTISIETP
jgi:hypothetical protein